MQRNARLAYWSKHAGAQHPAAAAQHTLRRNRGNLDARRKYQKLIVGRFIRCAVTTALPFDTHARARKNKKSNEKKETIQEYRCGYKITNKNVEKKTRLGKSTPKRISPAYLSAVKLTRYGLFRRWPVLIWRCLFPDFKPTRAKMGMKSDRKALFFCSSVASRCESCGPFVSRVT